LVFIAADNETEIARRLAVAIGIRERAVGKARAGIARARKLECRAGLAALGRPRAHNRTCIIGSAAAQCILWRDCTGLPIAQAPREGIGAWCSIDAGISRATSAAITNAGCTACNEDKSEKG
tara:strand:+ start:34678 stop:35043 length:366 start_codon:yes stop_codon:yes gene_type:complete